MALGDGGLRPKIKERKKYATGLDNSGNIEGISNAIGPQSRWECTPWAAEATSIPPAGPAAYPRLASPVGSRQATGPRRRARPGRVAGDRQPARLGLPGGRGLIQTR